jgi:purine-binding chemotaxis protein CheW
MEVTILTDDVPQIKIVLLGQLYPSPTTVSNQMKEYIRGITADMLMVLDMQRLLSDPRLIIQGND